MRSLGSHEDKKHLIARQFMEIVGNPPKELKDKPRITVSALARILGIDRKTFYNYFDDVRDMMIWIFRDYVKNMIDMPKFSEWTLVYPDKSLQDKYEDWPIYARNIGSNKDFHEGAFFKQMAYHWEENRDYYNKVFSEEVYLNLFDYIIALYLPVFREDVVMMLGDRDMPEIVIDFLAEYHAMGVFGRLRYHFGRTGKFIMQEELDSFWNYAHLTLMRTIDQCYEELPPSKIAKMFGNHKARYRYVGMS